MLAEFDYSGQPAKTFPFDQSKEHFSMFALKKFGLPALFWHGMLRGRIYPRRSTLSTAPIVSTFQKAIS